MDIAIGIAVWAAVSCIVCWGVGKFIRTGANEVEKMDTDRL